MPVVASSTLAQELTPTTEIAQTSKALDESTEKLIKRYPWFWHNANNDIPHGFSAENQTTPEQGSISQFSKRYRRAGVDPDQYVLLLSDNRFIAAEFSNWESGCTPTKDGFITLAIVRSYHLTTDGAKATAKNEEEWIESFAPAFEETPKSVLDSQLVKPHRIYIFTKPNTNYCLKPSKVAYLTFSYLNAWFSIWANTLNGSDESLVSYLDEIAIALIKEADATAVDKSNPDEFDVPDSLKFYISK